MERPYIICHMLSSLDGKINGPFMGAESVRVLGAEYAKLRMQMGADAWLYGTATTKEFTDFCRPDLPENCEVPEGDFIADSRAKLYYVSVDVDGEIGWESGTFCNSGKPPAHVIEVLTDSTPAAYKHYLREKGVSYILAGKKTLDCGMAVEKLHELFHIKTLLVCGGGIVNWSFLHAGVVDELSLLLAPVTDGGRGAASLFTQLASFTEEKTVEFLLKDAVKTEAGGLHLTYLFKR